MIFTQSISYFSVIFNLWFFYLSIQALILVLSTFPKAIFPTSTSQITISQVVTSQMYIFISGNIQKIRLGLLGRRRLQMGRVLQPGWARRPSAATSTDFGSFCLGKCTFGKLLLGKKPLAKYLFVTPTPPP